MSHKKYKDLLIPHALGSLEAAEARAVEEHLAECDECRAEFDSFQETAAALAFSAPAAQPSAEVREQVLERARTLPQQLAEQGDGTRRGEAITNGSSVVPLRTPSRPGWTSPQIYSAIAASLLIFALAGALIVLWQQNNAMQDELARLREDKILLTAPDGGSATLDGTVLAAKARGRLSYDRRTGRAMLVADGLPPAPPGKAYQLWFIADGKPLPGGVFTTDAAGHAELREQIPPAGLKAAVFAVTLERAGGVAAPEGETYLQGKASS